MIHRSLAIVFVAGGGFVAATGGLDRTDARAEAPAAAHAPGCRIVWGRPVADIELSSGVRLGGLSDLAPAQDAAPGHFWAITDRGPNGIVRHAGTKRRTLMAPDFVPTLVLLNLAGDGGSADGPIPVAKVLPLTAPGGTPLSGRSKAVTGRVALLAADGMTELANDPDGVDPEGVVQAADGTFWIAEEYGPSLLKVGRDATAIQRHVPHGTADPSAAIPQRETIPAAYARRRDNRGFEALALSPDNSRLWVLLQSPLDNPGPKAAKKTGNVRLLAFDTAAGRPSVEHLYRMGDPLNPAYLEQGAPPNDGKLCCMAPLGNDRLLVLEQDDDGHAWLYDVTMAGATDTLALTPPHGAWSSLEEIRDVKAAAIVPVTKRLVADLSEQRQAMAIEADGGTLTYGNLKLEGIAVVDDRHVLLANDDDFGAEGEGESRRRSYLWLLELDEPLPGVSRE